MERLAAAPIERDVILVEGEDAVAYLHTQLTQDVEGLAVGGSAWSFLLEPKSEILALLRVSRAADDLVVLDLPVGRGHAVRERLDGFLFRMDVRFDEAVWSGYSVRGPGSQEAVVSGSVVMRGVWPGCDSIDVLGPADVSIPDDLDELSASELDALRIRVGWPSNDDLDAKTTPAMTGIVAHSVSFTKGCYTGQEFVARVHYRDAAPPRRLVQVGFHPCCKPEVGESITVDGDTVGRLTSVSKHQPLALAFLDRGTDIPGEALLGTAPLCMGVLPVSTVEPDAPAPKPTTSTLTLG